jgi:hypothetical protein
MTMNTAGDPILRLLATLPLVTPPVAFDERVRSRCYLALAARSTVPVRRSHLARIAAGAMNATLAIAAGVYAAAAAFEALRLVGML